MFRRYLLALAIFLVALGMRFAVLPVEARLAFLTFYPAAVIAFYLCGTRAGWLTVALSAIAGYHIFSPPFWSMAPNIGSMISLTVYLLSSWLFAAIVGRLQQTSGALAETLAALQTSELQYQTILEEQSDWICRYREDGTVSYANAALCRAFGVRREDIIGRQWHPEVLPDDLAQVDEKLRSLSPAHPTVIIEKRVYTGSGLRWAQFVDHASFDAAGRLVGMQKVGRDVTERKSLEAQLRASSEEYRDLYDNAPCGYHSLDVDGRYMAINATALAWIGCSRDEVIGRCTPLDFFTPDSQARFRESFPAFKASGRIDGMLFDLRGRDGRVRRVSITATAIRDGDGQFLMSRSVMHDVTDAERIKEQLHQISNEQAAMLDHELIGILKTRDGAIVWKNRGIDRIFGFAADELIGESGARLYADDASHEHARLAADQALALGKPFRIQVQMVRRDGEPVWIDASGVMLSESPREALWLLADITPVKKYQEQIERLAHYDALTGLPNRLVLDDRMTQALAVARRSQQRVAVCYLDLDGFKPINDQHGHHAGDQLLRVVADRMAQALRANDTACRLGGDEFVLLLTGLDSAADCRAILERVVGEIRVPVRLDLGVEVQVTVSAGVALFPDQASSASELLRLADQAMYRAKRLRRGAICMPDETAAG